jgi:hypothetical protein
MARSAECSRGDVIANPASDFLDREVNPTIPGTLIRWHGVAFRNEALLLRVETV